LCLSCVATSGSGFASTGGHSIAALTGYVFREVETIRDNQDGCGLHEILDSI
jgi:hypothetical protein